MTPVASSIGSGGPPPPAVGVPAGQRAGRGAGPAEAAGPPGARPRGRAPAGLGGAVGETRLASLGAGHARVDADLDHPVERQVFVQPAAHQRTRLEGVDPALGPDQRGELQGDKSDIGADIDGGVVEPEIAAQEGRGVVVGKVPVAHQRIGRGAIGEAAHLDAVEPGKVQIDGLAEPAVPELPRRAPAKIGAEPAGTRRGRPLRRGVAG